jgi:hypothetical protein
MLDSSLAQREGGPRITRSTRNAEWADRIVKMSVDPGLPVWFGLTDYTEYTEGKADTGCSVDSPRLSASHRRPAFSGPIGPRGPIRPIGPTPIGPIPPPHPPHPCIYPHYITAISWHLTVAVISTMTEPGKPFKHAHPISCPLLVHLYITSSSPVTRLLHLSCL